MEKSKEKTKTSKPADQAGSHPDASHTPAKEALDISTHDLMEIFMSKPDTKGRD